jgi:carboxyl-terminal processing protease
MPRTIKTVIITLLLVVSLALSFGAGCALETRNTSSADQGLGVIEEGWNLIFQDYVARESLNATTLSQGALKGMVEALDDPYSAYLDAPTYQKSRSDMAGKYEGIGAYVGVKDGQIMIIAPIPDSPAAKAGIKAGDIILEIDGSSISEMSLEEAVLRIRGPEGTSVRLLILHQGETEPEEIEIVRSEIPVSSVYLEMREDIAYIYITNFSERTNEELSTALENVAKEAATGIILDLRSNPGGLLDAVIDVASRFLKEGVVLYVVDNQGNKSSFSARPGGVTTELPLVVLTDNYTASASEVLAGALQDHTRAIIAGTRTYGKGSVNTLYKLQDGSGLYLTTARWLTPDGRLIEGKGIEPDYTLELEGEDTILWAINYLKSNKE